MHPYHIPIWKAAPFCRLLLPFIVGIILQWYVQFSISFISCCLCCFLLAYSLLFFLAIETRYKLQVFQGVLLHLIIAVFAMLLTWQNDIRHDRKWFGHYYHDSAALVVQVAEPLTEKSRSFKCEGLVEAVYTHGRMIPVKGKILIYFSKDTGTILFHYGDMFLISKPLQRIKNSGNPGAFNYERYAAFQQLFHTAYIKGNEVVLLEQKKIPKTFLLLTWLRRKMTLTLQRVKNDFHFTFQVLNIILLLQFYLSIDG